MEPTTVNQFGENVLSLIVDDGLAMFESIRAEVNGAAAATDLGADALNRFGDAQVGLVVSTLDATTSDDDPNTAPSMFVGFFISDRDDTDEASSFPSMGPTGREILEVDFGQLLGAVANSLPSRYPFQYHCHLTASGEGAELAFALPITFWRTNSPFGPLTGARFELNARGARDGWIALSSDDDDLMVLLSFVRLTDISVQSIESAWRFIRRIYDKLVFPSPKHEGGAP